MEVHKLKYYEVVCFTPYCGEQEYFYLEIPDYEDIEDDKWRAEVDNLIMGNAYEWYDEDAEDDYEDFSNYLASCFAITNEISKIEYDTYTIF